MVTEKSASGVGISLKPLDVVGILGDHRTMVKFGTRNDEGYKSVLKNIDKILSAKKLVR